MTKQTTLAELLPEGLDDTHVQAIADLINEIVDNQVEAQVKILEAKVKAFLRSRVDIIKEHALGELTLESEDYRNAKLFEDIKSLVLLEAKADDEDSAVSMIKEGAEDIQKEYAEDIKVLLEKIEQLTDDNDSLKLNNRALKGKLNKLENNLTEIKETVEARKKPFKSSEKAQVVKSNVDKATEEKNTVVSEELTSLLSEESMRLMPQTRGN